MTKKYDVPSEVVTVPAKVLEIVKFEYDVRVDKVTLYINTSGTGAAFRVRLTQAQFDALMPKIVKEIDDIMDEVAAGLGGTPQPI